MTIRDSMLELGAVCEIKGARIAEIGKRICTAYQLGDDCPVDAAQLEIILQAVVDIGRAASDLRSHMLANYHPNSNSDMPDA